MHESEQAAQLNRTRRVATGLLLAMAAIFVASRMLESQYPWLSFVTAFAEAAMVGALADWFAVTALFRSPLGLPIPHTAIIPRNKDRIGDSLSDFLEHNFITQEIIREEMRKIDFAGIAARWLAQPENSAALARQIVRSVPRILDAVEDEQVQQFVQRHLAQMRQQTKFAPLLGEALAVLVAGNQHQVLFDRLIELAAQALDHNREYIRWKIHENSPRWIPKAIDERFYHRLLDGVYSVLDEMREDDSEWRMRVHRLAEDFIERLRTDPEWEEKIGGMLGDLLGHPIARDYALGLWLRIKMRLVEDARSDDSRLAARLGSALSSLGAELLSDETVQKKLNQWLRIVATETIVSRREAIADLVARVIRTWDAETMSRKLELHVGKDLQYIRINGTLVGGCVGLVLHTVSRFL